MIHNNRAYVVPLKEIQAHFVDRERPVRMASVPDEVDFLKRRLEAMTRELEAARRQTVTAQGTDAQRTVAPPTEADPGESFVDFQKSLADDLGKTKKPKPLNKAL
jgi:hypothetical protein